MRIGSNYNNYNAFTVKNNASKNNVKQNTNVSFQGVMCESKENQDAVDEILGNKVNSYDLASTAKGFDIWIFKLKQGGINSKCVGYNALFVDNKKGALKDISCHINKEQDEEARHLETEAERLKEQGKVEEAEKMYENAQKLHKEVDEQFKTDVEKFKQRLEDVTIWANADRNTTTCGKLSDRKAELNRILGGEEQIRKIYPSEQADKQIKAAKNGLEAVTDLEEKFKTSLKAPTEIVAWRTKILQI